MYLGDNPLVGNDNMHRTVLNKNREITSENNN